MDTSIIIAASAGVVGAGGLSKLFWWMFKKLVTKSENHDSRIVVLETNSLTKKHLDDTLDRTLIPFRQDMTKFGEHLTDAMGEIKQIRFDQELETRAKELAREIVKGNT